MKDLLFYKSYPMSKRTRYSDCVVILNCQCNCTQRPSISSIHHESLREIIQTCWDLEPKVVTFLSQMCFTI